MKEIDFSRTAWHNAQTVLDELSYKTDCVENGKLTIKPRYVVCIDDDPVSAFYACQIYYAAKKEFGIEPEILCVGGTGMLSKYLNEGGCSEGKKLAMVCEALGVEKTKILDKGTNTGANLKEIIDYLSGSKEPIIFCPTQRLSLRLERTVRFSQKQFPGTEALNAWFYVPKEYVTEMAQAYNGKELAGGLPLLSEVAAIYPRLRDYGGKFSKPLDTVPTGKTIAAAEWLAKHYPIRISRLPVSAPLQYIKMYFAVKNSRKEVVDDLHAQIKKWKQCIASKNL